MSNASEMVTIQCSEDAARALKAEIDAQPDSESELSDRRNLDGNTAAWIVAASLAVQSLPHILGFIGKFLDSGRVTEITVGDTTIKNPTPDDVKLLREMIITRTRAETKNE